MTSVHSGERRLIVTLQHHFHLCPKPGLSDALFLKDALLCLPLSKADSSSLWPTVNWQAEELKPTDVKQIYPGRKTPPCSWLPFSVRR